MPQIVIVGGGLSGLATAFRLRQFAPAADVTVLEPRDQPGGNIGTEEHDGFRVERGPNGFLDRTPSLPDLVRDLGLSDQLIAASEGSRKNRFLFLNGRLRQLPRGPLGLLTSPLLSLRGKWKFFTEPWRKPSTQPLDESIADFVMRRAGKPAADVFADALVTGIHGGDPAQLSVAATFPRLPRMEREAGSIIRGFLRAAKERSANASEGSTSAWSISDVVVPPRARRAREWARQCTWTSDSLRCDRPVHYTGGCRLADRHQCGAHRGQCGRLGLPGLYASGTACRSR